MHLFYSSEGQHQLVRSRAALAKHKAVPAVAEIGSLGD